MQPNQPTEHRVLPVPVIDMIQPVDLQNVGLNLSPSEGASLCSFQLLDVARSEKQKSGHSFRTTSVIARTLGTMDVAEVIRHNKFSRTMPAMGALVRDIATAWSRRGGGGIADACVPGHREVVTINLRAFGNRARRADGTHKGPITNPWQ